MGFTSVKNIKKPLREGWRQSWMLVPYGWHILFLMAPIFIIVALSFSEFSPNNPPYRSLFQWVHGHTLQIYISFSNYLTVLSDPFYRRAFGNSLWISAISTGICLLLGYPMAYGIVQSRWRGLWLLLAIVPFFTSFLVRVYAWMTLLSPMGLINHLLITLGLSPLNLMNHEGAVIVGVVYSYLPFMIFPLVATLDKMDPHLLEAAYDLGCKPFSAFWRVTLPLSRSGIFAGSSLVFIPAMGEFIIPELLGGPTSLTIGRLLWYEFFTNRDWPLAAAMAVMIIILILIPIVLFEKLQNSEERKDS
jgi:putrescine transport system permease protein